VAEVTGPLLVLDADGDPLRGVPDDAVLVVGSERAGVGPQARSALTPSSRCRCGTASAA
jgi:hypothetical protein